MCGPGAALESADRNTPSAMTLPLLSLQPWSWTTPEGFTLRGMRSVPSGRPVLHFMHGTGLCTLAYWPLLVPLLDRVDLFLADVHGHGDSDGQSPFVGWNRSAALAAAAWQAHAPDYGHVPVIVGGHSLGAILGAMMLADHPQAFSAGLLLDPVLMPPLMRAVGRVAERAGIYQRNRLARRARARRTHWPSRQAARDYLHGRGVFADWHDASLEAYIDHGMVHHPDGSCTLKCPPGIEADIFGSLPQGLWRRLEAVSVPTDVVMGAASYPFALRAAWRWGERNPQVRLHAVPGSHCWMQADPAGSAARLRALLPR